MPVIDTHTHIIASDQVRYRANPLGGHQSGWSAQRPADARQLLGAMDAAGVEKAVLVQASTCYGHDNSYIADTLDVSPERFAGVFSADILADDAVEVIQHWRGRGFAGMRLFTTGSTMPTQAEWLDDPKSFAGWECAEQIDLPVCVQMSIQAAPKLIGLAKRFPKVKILVDHLAKPELSDGFPYLHAANLWALADYRNIFLKVTPRTLQEASSGKATWESFFRRLVDEFSAPRLMWGSNFPASEGTMTSLVEWAGDGLQSLSQDEQDWIFYKTAGGIYPSLAMQEKG
jgi:predicted TIM-barrel fold metal-dependent hydrolase